MKYLLIALFSSLFLTCAIAQKENTAPLISPKIAAQQYPIHKYKLAKNSHDYQLWKQSLPKKKRNLVIKSAIAGLIAGAIVGSALASPADAICKAIPNPFGEKEKCPPRVTTGAMIGGGLGLLIGLGAGQENTKKIKFTRNRYSF